MICGGYYVLCEINGFTSCSIEVFEFGYEHVYACRSNIILDLGQGKKKTSQILQIS